ncbi:MAG TPA: sulfite exporter TauE/SafE family protein [Pyrinomonadaceae bacterium]|nr:sulfite exporter TauE/SafE family protein [Pyrinomonadaceae bacterium]
MISGIELAILIVVFLVTSIIGVVTGSNSLIAVPAMFQLGIPAREAVATNMFALVFMAVGGTIPFARAGKLNVRRTWPLLVLTAIGSTVGALLVGLITDQTMRIIVSVAMFAVAAFILIRRNAGVAGESVSAKMASVALVGTFLLAIYGGLFSGGYVTMLTALLVATFGLTFSEAVGATKLLNIISSSVASAVFIWQGLVDFRLGIILGITMFIGGYIGGHYASKMNEIWLRRIFLAAVFALAIKTIYDII